MPVSRTRRRPPTAARDLVDGRDREPGDVRRGAGRGGRPRSGRRRVPYAARTFTEDQALEAFDTARSVETLSGAIDGEEACSALAADATVQAADSSLGEVLVDAEGRTLYLFEADSGTTSSCTGGCETAWPPLTVTDAPVAGTGLDTTKLAHGEAAGRLRSGHLQQRTCCTGSRVTRRPGTTNGQGVGNLWFAVSPEGEKIAG